MCDSFPGAKKDLALMAFFLLFFLLYGSQIYAQEASQDSVTVDQVDQAAIDQGRSLFKANCQVCHQINQQLIGPALKDVTQRRPIPWIESFIRNSQQVIDSGDEYAVELFNRFNRTPMPAFQFLSDEEISSIIAFIDEESKAAPVVAEETPAAPGEDTGGGVSNQYINIILIGILIVLALILIVLAMIISTLSKYLEQRGEAEAAPVKGGFKKFVASRQFIGIATFIFFAIVAKVVIDQLYRVGVQQGYAPEQPVWFSHKVHAGTYQMDCNYCHTGAQVSANAGIPSLNICMNCHDPQKGGIVTGTITGETELAKVISAFQNNEPIQWIRVHNLPDLSYFNHSQHVNVGNVECQTCHGLVEEMDVVRQEVSLTMGWCIDCHRTTPLNTQGNGYYDKLVEMHEQLGKGAFLVQDIGGTECSKCHY